MRIGAGRFAKSSLTFIPAVSKMLVIAAGLLPVKSQTR